MRRPLVGLGSLVTLLGIAGIAMAQANKVPAELESWRGWVLKGEEFRVCPALLGQDMASADAHRCAWPGALDLAVDAHSGRFEQQWQVYSDSWIILPGSAEHWPRAVTVNGSPAAVVEHDSLPQLRLVPGTYRVSGRFEWTNRPPVLAVSPQTAIVRLLVDGDLIAQPERPNGALRLGNPSIAATEKDRLEVQVYRLLQDENPALLTTELRLFVTGDAREVVLGPALPEGYAGISLASPLAARLEADGRLRVQLRPGRWIVSLIARGQDVASALTMPTTAKGAWPTEEIWSFAGNDRLRVAVAEGAASIDAAQANVGEAWRGYPAFRLASGETLKIAERSRGLTDADENQLQLTRRLWLSFDHSHYVARDEISGSMRRDWRLDMVAPFTLENATSGGDTLLITRSPGNDERTGVELRAPTLQLATVAQADGGAGALPATGWAHRFDAVRGTLILPVGHRLIAALGPDEVPDAWLNRWGLWNVFGVCLVAAFAWRIAGRSAGLLALGALALSYQDAPMYVWLWVNLLIAVGLAAVVPEGGLRRFVQRYCVLSFAILGIALIPLIFGQLRLAVHPQLEIWAPGYAMAGKAEPWADAAAEAMPETMEQVVVTGARREVAAPPPASARLGGEYKSVLQRYASGTVLQAGRGLPAWQYRAYDYAWSGPVEATETVNFLYIGKVGLALWRVTACVLLAALFSALLRASQLGLPRAPTSAAALVTLFVLASAGMSLLPAPVLAASTPDAALLQELKQRLTEAPLCAPDCADVPEARIAASGNQLEVTLTVTALADVAVPVPQSPPRWQLERITLDGTPVAALRERNGALYVAVPKGVHSLRMAGRIAAVDSLQLAFQRPPRAVVATGDGWDFAGMADGRLVGGTLEVIRSRKSTAESFTESTGGVFPTFVRVERRIDFDLNWSVTTTVTRVAPAQDGFNIDVPLLPGEAVLSESLRVDAAGVAHVGFGPGQSQVGWRSSLPRSTGVTLSMQANSERSEVWVVQANPEWRLRFSGLPAVLPENTDAPNWTFEFHPRAGEKLEIDIARPVAAPGPTLAIDRVNHEVAIGHRSVDAELTLSYRSTQGGRHNLSMPPEARLRTLIVDGQAQQLRPENGELSLNLLPGAHQVSLAYTLTSSAGVVGRPPAIDLHAAASNVTTNMTLPERRWPLLAFGAGVGPALLYWSELVVFVLVAIALGRWRASPLRTHEWLLLGLGLSTLSWYVFALMLIWFVALAWRRERGGAVQGPWFNLVQILLGVLTAVALLSLAFAGIRYGLLASPDMGVAGPGSGGNRFSWFVDETAGALPTPRVFSVPLWIYRVLMFAWASWIVWAGTRWLRWAWSAFSSGGYWRASVIAKPEGRS
ncbi:MAG: hypothetical protein R3E77_02045 [Steroidobacteraceae bacterium]